MEKIKGLEELLNNGLDVIYPSYAYGLVTPNISYKNCNGYKTTEKDEKVDITTLYDMASCTKVVVTTTSIILLLEKGLLRLYDSVSLYLEEFKHKDITIFDLLTHSSGLPAGLAHHSKSKEEIIKLIYETELVYPKGEKIIYSDIGFMLLGFIIEKISKLSLDVFATNYIFKPLEMNSSCFNPVDKEKCCPTEYRDDFVFKGLVKGFVHDENAYILGGVCGHAGLFSNVLDISNFIKMVLNNGVYKDKQFLSAASIDLLFTPFVRMPKGVSLDPTQRGLGWIVRGDYCAAGDLASQETIHHTGFTGTNIFIDRINKVGFTLLTNRVHPTRKNVLLIPFRGKIGNYIIANFGGRNAK